MPVKVISGDATVTSTQTCRTTCTTNRNGTQTCTTSCTTNQNLVAESFPIPTSPSRFQPVYDPQIVYGDVPYSFNAHVIGDHKISNTYAIGHAQGYRHRSPSVRFYFPGYY